MQLSRTGILHALYVLFCFSAMTTSAGATAFPNQTEGEWTVKDFRFSTGETLPEVRLHYTTLGQPRRDASGHVVNAVLLLHGTTTTGKAFLMPSIAGELFGPGQVLDAEKYYIILPDALGRGRSSKPSDGLHARFPRYGYADMVQTQYRLLTEGLNVDHLRLVLGFSMGGMQTWMWGETHPTMMDALMPLASFPVEISGRNFLWRKILSQSIRNDPDWNNGEYTSQPRHYVTVLPLFKLMTLNAAKLQQMAPTRADAETLYENTAQTTNDANDFLYWLESSWDYDPEPGLGKIVRPLFAVNFADDLINPVELGVLDRVIPTLPGARFAVVPANDTTLGHQTLNQAAMWAPFLKELLDSLPPIPH